MMITVIVDEIIAAHPAGSKAGTFRRVERDRFEAVANAVHNVACAGDELFFSESLGEIIVRLIVQRCRPLIRTNSGGARVMSMWLDVVTPELDAQIHDHTVTYEQFAKRHEVW